MCLKAALRWQIFFVGLTGCSYLHAQDGSASPGLDEVQVQQAPLRAQASALADALRLLPYGTHVEILETREDWLRVRVVGDAATPGTGWLKPGEVAPARVEMRSGGVSALPTPLAPAATVAGKALLAGDRAAARSGGLEGAIIGLERIESGAEYRIDRERARGFLDLGSVSNEP